MSDPLDDARLALLLSDRRKRDVDHARRHLRGTEGGRASDEAAKAAAEEIAPFENRLATLASDLKLVKWMLGTNRVVSTGVLIRLFLGRVALQQRG